MLVQKHFVEVNMSKVICPFLQSECDFNCVFNNSCFDEGDKENCDLLDAIQTIRSFQSPDNQVDIRQQKIISELESISSNTGYDQTDSSDIKELLEDIKVILKKRN